MHFTQKSWNYFIKLKKTLLVVFMFVFCINVFASKNKQEMNNFINLNKEIKEPATINKNYKKKIKNTKASNKAKLNVINKILQAYAYSNNYDTLNKESIELYLEALNEANKINDAALLIYVNTEIGYFYYTYNEYLKAMPYFIRTAQLLDKTPEDNLIQAGSVFKKNAYFYGSLGEHEKSVAYLKKALKFTPSYAPEYGAILNNIGSVYYKMEEVQQAENYFLKTKSVSLENNDPVRYAKALGDLALIYYDKSNYQKAVELLKEDILISQKNNAERNIMYAQILLSKVYVELKQFPEAKQNLQLANNYVLKKGYLKSHGYEIAEINLAIALKTNDKILELSARRALDSLGAEISDKDGQEAINIANWETQKSQFNSEIELEKSKLEKATLINWIVAGLLVIFTLIVILLIIYTNRKIKKDLSKYENNILNYKIQQLESQSKLEASNLSLKSYETYLNNQNKHIELLESKLKKIQNTSGGYDKVIESIHEIIENASLSDKNWLKLKNTFIKEESDYYHYILTHFPDINEMQLRIVILTKMSLLPAEVSMILNVSKDYIEETLQTLRIKYNGVFDKHLAV